MTDGTSRQTMPRRVALGLLGSAVLGPAGARAAPPPDADRAAVVDGNAEFGLDLYAQLRTGGGNLFYSPYSISCALAMTYAGARGSTADEMAKVLRFSLPPGRVHPAFGGLIREINAPGTKRANELSTANALWSQRGHPFERDFQQIARDSYRAALEEVDFARATETARRTINAWVEKETQDRIKDLIQEGVLNADTVLVLTNAIYFKGTWEMPFRKEATRPGDFHRDSRRAISNVPLMDRENVYGYLDGDTFQAIELPYRANELSMVIVLPREVDGLGELERALTARRAKDWMARMARQPVRVILPRFKATAQFRLAKALTSLGMREAFVPGRANLSGMEKGGRAFLSEVIHKAYVDVNETGTEAAAATAVAVEVASARLPAPPVPVFRADHPFFFLIRDNRTGALLFAGRLTDPLAG